MSDVPSDLFLEILLRLPAESLLRFRAVCKDWRRTIDDPSFIKSHTLHQHSSNTNSNSCTLLILDSKLSCLYSLSLDSLNDADHAQQTVDLTRITTLDRSGGPFEHDWPMPSCHGLVLISRSYSSNFKEIYNPLTRESHRLSDPSHDLEIPLAGVGLGYDYVAHDYQVVTVEQSNDFDGKTVFETFIYSLKSGTWKWLDGFTFDSDATIPYSDSAYLNGALHWVSDQDKILIVFDLGSKEYRSLPMPPLDTRFGKPYYTFIDALDGCLILSCCYTSKGLWTDGSGMEELSEGWIMEGTKWIKLYSFVGVNVMREFRPAAYLKSKGEVVFARGSHFYLLDVYSKSMKKVTIQGLPKGYITVCQNSHGSLIRLDGTHVGGSAAAKTTPGLNRNNAQTRLKLSVTVDDFCDVSIEAQN